MLRPLKKLLASGMSADEILEKHKIGRVDKLNSRSSHVFLKVAI